MSDDERRTRPPPPASTGGAGGTFPAPPNYADPIVLRMRFVPRAVAEKPFPTHVASKAAWAGYASSDDLAEAVRRAGYGQAAPAAPVGPVQRADAPPATARVWEASWIPPRPSSPEAVTGERPPTETTSATRLARDPIQRVVDPRDPVTGEPEAWENPSERLQHMGDGGGRSDAGVPRLLEGQQGKHIEGAQNYEPRRSTLTADPTSLLSKFAGHGEQVGNIPVGQPSSRERFDAGQVIGVWRNREGTLEMLTTRGIIQYAKDGAHIIPSRPKGMEE
jgi:hypothetical protein